MLPSQNKFIQKLYKRNFSKLKAYAEAQLENPALAEELVQDTFHEASRKINDVIRHDSPDGWLMRTLQNKLKNYRRAAAKELVCLLSLDDGTLVATAAMPSAEDIVVERSELLRAQETIESVLSADEQYILRRIIFDGASHLDVAKELGISVWASQKRLERIRDKLSEYFPGYR